MKFTTHGRKARAVWTKTVPVLRAAKTAKTACITHKKMSYHTSPSCHIKHVAAAAAYRMRKANSIMAAPTSTNTLLTHHHHQISRSSYHCTTKTITATTARMTPYLLLRLTNHISSPGPTPPAPAAAAAKTAAAPNQVPLATATTTAQTSFSFSSSCATAVPDPPGSGSSSSSGTPCKKGTRKNGIGNHEPQETGQQIYHPNPTKACHQKTTANAHNAVVHPASDMSAEESRQRAQRTRSWAAQAEADARAQGVLPDDPIVIGAASNAAATQTHCNDAELIMKDALIIDPAAPAAAAGRSQRTHRATLVWLHNLGESLTNISALFSMIAPAGLRIVAPNAPHMPLTALQDEEAPAWFDVYDMQNFRLSEERAAADAELGGGTTESLDDMTRRLCELIEQECLLLSQRSGGTENPSQSAARVFIGGFGQGAAMALYAGLRFRRQHVAASASGDGTDAAALTPLGGIVACSGFIPFPLPELAARRDEFDDVRALPLPPVWASHGAADVVVPLSFAKMRYKKLQSEYKKCGVASTVYLREAFEQAHSLSAEVLLQMQQWIVARVPA